LACALALASCTSNSGGGEGWSSGSSGGSGGSTGGGSGGSSGGSSSGSGGSGSSGNVGSSSCGGSTSGGGGSSSGGGAAADGGSSSGGDGAASDGASGNDFTLPYYRIRIEFLDQGDWTTLQIVDPSKVIAVRQMSLMGTPNVLGVQKDQLALNTNLGSDLSVVADYALDPSAIDAPFQLSLTKGGAGTVTIRVSTVVGTTATVVKEILKQATQPLAIDVDLSSLKGVPPALAPMAPVKCMGLALYYPWYSLGTWVNNPVLRDTPQTPYASDDPTAIARQIDQAQSAGINGFTVSWIGPNSSSDNNTKLMLTEAAKKGFHIGFFLETTGGNLAQNTQTAIDWLTYIGTQYSSNPGVLSVAGKPVVTPWLTDTISLATWTTIRAAVRANGTDVWLMQDTQDMTYLDVFDGVRYSAGITGLGEKVRYYSVLADHPAPKLWMGTAMPGFDERLIPGRGPNPRYIDRQNGAYFHNQLDAVFANSPQWVMIDTWNEWFENTYIEPSVNYGDQYLQIAGGYLKSWVQQ
jgi:hypothetical protein